MKWKKENNIKSLNDPNIKIHETTSPVDSYDHHISQIKYKDKSCTD